MRSFIVKLEVDTTNFNIKVSVVFITISEYPFIATKIHTILGLKSVISKIDKHLLFYRYEYCRIKNTT